MAVPKGTLVKIYTDMVRCRLFEEKHIELWRAGKTIVGWHGARGEEGLCAVYSQLRRDDFCGYTHRIYYPWLCKGIPTRELMAEGCGKITGTAKGKGGTHISGMDVGIFGRSGMQGGHFPLLTGAAWMAKVRGAGQVAVCTAGDGAFTAGLAHESLNPAAVFKLPIVFLCDNNGFNMQMPQSLNWAQPDIAKMAVAYDMPSAIVDGYDPVAVAEAAQVAIERARSGSGPTLLEVKLYRVGPHGLGLAERPLEGYKDPEEEAYYAQKDPIKRLGHDLLDWGVLTQADVERIRQEARAEMEDAAHFAEESPEPEPEDAYKDIYV